MDDPRPITVDPTAAGMRADVYLAHRFALYSRSGAAEAIRSGEVVSTSRTLKPASLLKAGEVLHLHSLKLAPQGEKPPCPPVLHEDDHVLAFNKPAGMLCHPVGQAFAWGVINLARERYPGESLHLAHRLDRETSGVLLLARSDAANRHLKACFKARSVEKTYLAVVRGQVAWEEQEVDAPIGDDADSPIRLKQGVRPDGHPARTRFVVRERKGDRTLVEVHPHTGRTHQIRVHLAHLGHPILGDKIYGQPPEVFLSLFEGWDLPGRDELLEHPRHCLHAASLQLTSPGGDSLSIHAPFPDDMRTALDSQAPLVGGTI